MSERRVKGLPRGSSGAEDGVRPTARGTLSGLPGFALGGLVLRGLVLLMIAGLAAACSGAPPVRYYELTVPAADPGAELAAQSAAQSALDSAGTPAASAAVVRHGRGVRAGVERFRVDPPYDQDRIVYRVASSPNEVGFYAYHRWATPLATMLALETADLLRARPGIAVAEPERPEGAYDVVVGGRLLELDEVDGPAGEEARVEVELTLTQAGGSGDEIWRGRFRGTASGDVADVAGVVALMERALADALGRGTSELAGHLPDPAQEPDPSGAAPR